MDLIKAYAHQVAGYLPVKQREEVSLEVYDELSADFETQSNDRPELSVTDFLNSKPHPMKLATQLSDEKHTHLIGPMFYFSFIETLKLVLGLNIIFHYALAALISLTNGDWIKAFIQTTFQLPGSLLMVTAIVMGIFIAIERSGGAADWLNDWDVKKLKPITDLNRASRLGAATQFATSCFFILLISGLLPGLADTLTPKINVIDLQLPLAFVIILLSLLTIDAMLAAIRFVQDYWSRQQRIATIAVNILWIVTMAVLWHLKPWYDNDLPTFVLNIMSGIPLVIIAFALWDSVEQALLLQRESKNS